MLWRVPNVWQDGQCFILGGGNSMPRQFGVPENLITKVISGEADPSTYSPYFEPIQMKRSIAVNQAFRIGYWMDILFFGDNGFFLKNEKDILRFPKIKVSCHARFAKYESIKYLKREKKAHGISDDPSEVCWNSNSGSAAISIAAHAGCKQIILLGFDMTMLDGQKHWHGMYKQIENKKRNRPPRKMQKINAVFSRHMMGFDQIAKDAKKRNIEILNCSPVSRIEQFKKVQLKDII